MSEYVAATHVLSLEEEDSLYPADLLPKEILYTNAR